MSSEEDNLENEDNDSTTSSDPEDEEEIRKRVPTLAAGREKRSTAGTKMQALLSNIQLEAEDNEFYNSTYGGFNEEDEDGDFASDQEEADDELDSDFDVDEAQIEDKEVDGDGDEESKTSRRGKKVKLAYEISAQNRARKEKQNKAVAKKVEAKKEVAPRSLIPVKRPLQKPPPIPVSDEKRVLRQRVSLSKDDEDDYEPVAKKKRGGAKRRKDKDDKVWTQEELLEEAKKTEIDNLKSLEKYQLLELEKLESKKRSKRTERKVPSSYIRYVSTSMPLVEEIAESPKKKESIQERSRMARTFISFSDDHAFKTSFPCLNKIEQEPVGTVGGKRSNMSKIKRGEAVCPISNLKARYFDPVTQLPFASSTTFRALREAYGQQLEMFYGKILKPEGINQTEDGPVVHAKTLAKLKSDGVLDWLEHRKKMKQDQTSSVSITSGN